MTWSRSGNSGAGASVGGGDGDGAAKIVAVSGGEPGDAGCGRDRPTASAPITWAEVERCTHAAQLTFTADDVLDRVQRVGDLLAQLDDAGAPLPAR